MCDSASAFMLDPNANIFTNPPAELQVITGLLSLGMLSFMSLLRPKMHLPSQLISYHICLSNSMTLAFRCVESLTCCLQCWIAQTNSHLVNVFSQQFQRNNNVYSKSGKCIPIYNAACCCYSSLANINQAENWIALESQPPGHYFCSRHVCWLTAQMIVYHLCDKVDGKHPDGLFYLRCEVCTARSRETEDHVGRKIEGRERDNENI